MKDEAVKAGYYNSPIGKSFPKMQILTIEGLLSETVEAKHPDLHRGGYILKKLRPDRAAPGQPRLPLVPEAASLMQYLRKSEDERKRVSRSAPATPRSRLPEKALKLKSR